MSCDYVMQVRDADMQGRKALMCANLSDVLVEAGGVGDLSSGTEALLETLARNGIDATFTIITGPYSQALHADGKVDYS